MQLSVFSFFFFCPKLWNIILLGLEFKKKKKNCDTKYFSFYYDHLTDITICNCRSSCSVQANWPDFNNAKLTCLISRYVKAVIVFLFVCI